MDMWHEWYKLDVEKMDVNASAMYKKVWMRLFNPWHNCILPWFFTKASIGGQYNVIQQSSIKAGWFCWKVSSHPWRDYVLDLQKVLGREMVPNINRPNGKSALSYARPTSCTGNRFTVPQITLNGQHKEIKHKQSISTNSKWSKSWVFWRNSG